MDRGIERDQDRDRDRDRDQELDQKRGNDRDIAQYRSRIRRIGLTGAAACCAAALLLGRLAWLQVVPLVSDGGRHVAMTAVAQRHDRLVIDTGRGPVFDRHGVLLTGDTYAALAAFPAAEPRGSQRQLERLAEAAGLTLEELEQWLGGLEQPAFRLDESGRAPLRLHAEAANIAEEAGVAGVYVLPYTPRDSSLYAAEHVVGYISQHPERLAKLYAEETARGELPLDTKVGGSGLELSLERLLRGIGPSAAYHMRSASGRPEPAVQPLRIMDSGGEGSYSGNAYYPLSVHTTLDSRLQRALADAADKAGMTDGAIVVLDAANADVLAMVSRPEYDPLRPGLQPEAPANRTLRAASPGSVFKLVTAAAALETGAVQPRETFECNGEYGKYGLSCWKHGGHGIITLAEALAQSCNVAFAEIAERLTPEQLQTYADRLGFGRAVGWSGSLTPGTGILRPLGEEEAGRIFAGRPAPSDGGLMAQTGIGQRDVAMTPLQAANAVVALLHGGEVQAPRVVTEVRYATGGRMGALEPKTAGSRYGRIMPGTARTLLLGMEAVVAEGTGRALHNAAWPLAGKSGTAQAALSGKPVNHQWFVGYGPVDRPRYAVAVAVFNRPAGSAHLATTLFGMTMDRLAAYEEGSAAVR